MIDSDVNSPETTGGELSSFDVFPNLLVDIPILGRQPSFRLCTNYDFLNVA